MILLRTTLAPQVAPELQALQARAEPLVLAELLELAEPQARAEPLGLGEPPGLVGRAETQETLATEQWGARVWGRTIELTRTGRTLWLGTVPMPQPDQTEPSSASGGLVKLNLDSGEVDVLDAELPQTTNPDTNLTGALPTAGVVQDGDRTIAVTPAGLVVGTGNTFAVHELVVNGTKTGPNHIAIDRDGNRKRLWVTTTVGLLQLDADSLDLVSTIDGATLAETLAHSRSILRPVMCTSQRTRAICRQTRSRVLPEATLRCRT